MSPNYAKRSSNAAPTSSPPAEPFYYYVASSPRPQVPLRRQSHDGPANAITQRTLFSLAHLDNCESTNMVHNAAVPRPNQERRARPQASFDQAINSAVRAVPRPQPSEGLFVSRLDPATTVTDVESIVSSVHHGDKPVIYTRLKTKYAS